MNGVLSAEIFTTKNSEKIMMAVPRRCGLKNASALRVRGSVVEAVAGGSILPVDFGSFGPDMLEKLRVLGRRGGRLPVGEFMAGGLFDAYYLDVLVA